MFHIAAEPPFTDTFISPKPPIEPSLRPWTHPREMHCLWPILCEGRISKRGQKNNLGSVSRIPPVTISNHQNRTPHATWGENTLVKKTKHRGRESDCVERGGGIGVSGRRDDGIGWRGGRGGETVKQGDEDLKSLHNEEKINKQTTVWSGGLLLIL